jgi:hypothetical protein
MEKPVSPFEKALGALPSATRLALRAALRAATVHRKRRRGSHPRFPKGARARHNPPGTKLIKMFTRKGSTDAWQKMRISHSAPQKRSAEIAILTKNWS